MDKPTLKRIYRVDELTLTVNFLDRGLRASERALGTVNLDQTSIACVHPECAGADVRYSSKLREKITQLKEANERKGSFVIQCQGARRGSRGHQTCGGWYKFQLEIQYGDTSQGNSAASSVTK
jgi:hypothetical protein